MRKKPSRREAKESYDKSEAPNRIATEKDERAAADTTTNNRITNLAFSAINGTLAAAQIVDKLLQNRMYGDNSVDQRAINNSSVRTWLDGVYSQLGHGHFFSAISGTLNAAQVVDDLIITRMIANGSVGLAKLSSALNGGDLAEYRLRIIGTRWGGTSGAASSDTHAHSVSFKQLPQPLRTQLIAGRRLLRATRSLEPKTYLLEGLLLAVLHMLMDDAEETAEEREVDISDDPQGWKERFPNSGIAAYKAAHGDGGFSLNR